MTADPRPDSTNEPREARAAEQATRLAAELKARKEGEIAQARLAAIVESSDDAIVSKGLDGIITSWNQGAEKMFGYTAAEAVGKHVLLIVPPERHDEERMILSRLGRGERVDHFETQRMAKDGRRLDISLTVSPVRDSSGTIVGASKIARDITERKRIERQREGLLEAERFAREEAQRINTIKDEFLATLSHELRTPLNAIMGWAQLLASGKLESSEFTEAGHIIERNARAQTQLIDDLLDMSRIASGKLQLNLRLISPVDVIYAAIETVLPSSDAKDIGIEKRLDTAVPPISGDPARLQQVVWNLLSNAVKFTPKGGKIRVLLEQVDSHLELSVSDTGQGIAPEFLPHLFERFRQADASTTRRHGGLGLGLSIVKQIAEMHGGTVTATSPGLNQGATFTIQLPIRAAYSPSSKSESRHPTGTSLSSDVQWVDLSNLKLLIVDDEQDARELIERLLVESGAQVQVAESAQAALTSIVENPPDVLISDIGMPEVDGYELLRLARELPGGNMPAIALTAFARTEDRTRALMAGYIAHVAKPVEPSELLATVAVVSRRAIGLPTRRS
jgi:PAS domain S-box-containing protein